jgi:ribosomal protein S27AE
MQKACFKCKVVKPLSEFYKHSRMADGHLNKCKDCAKDDVSKHRAQNIEKVRQYDRNRANRSERIKAGVELTRIWRAEDRRRGKAHSAVYRAVKNGKLVREPCCRCGDEKTLAHHEDHAISNATKRSTHHDR